MRLITSLVLSGSGLLLAASAVASSSAFVPEIIYQARASVSMPSVLSAPRAIDLEELLPPPPLAVVPAVVGVPLEPVQIVIPARDVWERMRADFAMPDLKGPLVQKQTEYYLKRPELLKAIFERSRPYIHYVLQELERRKMPAELALLPMVECAYNPYAVSSAEATGIWQFIPKTAKKYGLAENDNYDGRRDIVAATRAALDYLEFLYGLLGDRHLALASYNWGEEQVMAAMERNRARGRPTTYDALVMPEETRWYVPKLQALKNIVVDPALHRVKLDPVPNEPHFVVVKNRRNLDVRVAAKLADIPLNTFLALNPGFNRPVVSVADTSVIVVPVDKAETLVRNLENFKGPVVPRTVAKPSTNPRTSDASSPQAATNKGS